MNLNIASLREAYTNNEITPRTLLETIHSRCEQYSEHNIWIHLLSMAELEPYITRLEQADASELPLYGIPFAIKDNIDLAGVPTTAACAAFAYTPERSAFVVEQLIAAGAIPVGKTNLDQFATGLVGTRSPEPWGACKNAFNKAYISGGSSSGSAVAVALGLASFSLGTDTAGSGRVPAAFNNLVGLKPSKGLLSTRGVVPACRSLDCVSIFALSTDDANAVFNITAVYDDQDQYARGNIFENNHRHYGLPEQGFSFAVPQEHQLEFFGDASAQALFEKTVRSMQELGGVKHVLDFSVFIDAAKLLYDGPWVAERYAAIENLISQQPEALLPVTRTIIGSAENKTAIDAFRAEYQMQSYRVQAKRLLADFDFLLTPTAGTIYRIDQVKAEPIALNSNLGYYTNYMNLLDCAAVAVPAGFLDNGLPWGVTLVSPCMRDRRLLSYANRWQQYSQIAADNLASALLESATGPVSFSHAIQLIVCGAHMDGLALNWQLRERGARLLEKTTSSSCYRMFVIEGSPQRPGMVRDASHGVAIEIEIWQLPEAEFGGFVAAIPAPLGIGKVETCDGRYLPGFICEPYAISGANEISQLGGWRRYLADLN
jgi:allophanate hydrolase